MATMVGTPPSICSRAISLGWRRRKLLTDSAGRQFGKRDVEDFGEIHCGFCKRMLAVIPGSQVRETVLAIRR